MKTTGMLYTTSLLAIGALVHAEDRDGLAEKRGAVGQGYSSAMTAAETNYTGKIEGDQRVLGICFQPRTVLAINAADAAYATELESLLHNCHVEIKHEAQSGGTNVESIGRLAHWPAPFGKRGEDLAVSSPISNMGNGVGTSIARFAEPLILKDGDTPRIQYKPGVSAPTLTLGWEIHAVLLVEPA